MKVSTTDYFYYNSRLSYGALSSVIFDHLVPSPVTYLSKDELAGWFPQERFADVTITSRNNMSWRAHGVCTDSPSPHRA